MAVQVYSRGSFSTMCKNGTMRHSLTVQMHSVYLNGATLDRVVSVYSPLRVKTTPDIYMEFLEFG